MAARGVGLAAPRNVHGCTIRNNSADAVNVQVLYADDADDDISNAVIPAGEAFSVGERIKDHGSFTTRKTINSIEVTRANGQTQKLTAPFDGVFGIELNRTFVIDDSQISSGNNS